MEYGQLDTHFTKSLFQHLQDGIIIMNEYREIIQLNQSAEKLMGWRVGDVVPYCSYCEERPLKEGEEKCYLIANKGDIPYFSSKMPGIGDYLINVEMSNALIYEQEDKKKHYLLVLRDRTIEESEEAARLSKKMLHHLIEAKEVEHRRLSQELHDGIGQSLYSVAIALDNLSITIEDDKLSSYMEEVREELGRAMEDVTAYSHALRPKSLDQLGLIPTVENLIESLHSQKENLQITLDTNFSSRLTAIAEINIYRVVQEALHNMMKYSEATNVQITFVLDEEKLEVTIKDNGVGFNVQEKSDGLGLLHIRERISQLKGETTIQSKKGEGTTVIINIPAIEVIGGRESSESINS